MDKNYYDILQINRNASPEIIEKAYKTLAKKYHPDLQLEENKKQAEEILKQINKAYEILSDSDKKQAYDNSLREQEIQSKIDASNSSLQNELRYRQQQELLHQQQKQFQEQLQREQNLAYQQQLEQARQKAYHDAYIQDLKNRGYKIRYKKSLKDYIKSLITILCTLLVLFLLWQIPFIKNFFINIYLQNELIHSICDIFLNFLHKF